MSSTHPNTLPLLPNIFVKSPTIASRDSRRKMPIHFDWLSNITGPKAQFQALDRRVDLLSNQATPSGTSLTRLLRGTRHSMSILIKQIQASCGPRGRQIVNTDPCQDLVVPSGIPVTSLDELLIDPCQEPNKSQTGLSVRADASVWSLLDCRI